MLSPLIFIFVLFAVVAISSGPGGRAVRYFALVLLIVSGLSLIAYAVIPMGRTFTWASVALDGAILAAALWLYWRDRALWVGLQVVVQTITTVVDFIHYAFMPKGAWGAAWWAQWWLISVLVYLQLGILVVAALRRHFGPPYPVPRKLQPARAG
ncbi:hypothetical protein [Caulobacter sp. 17J80-11]|uniref:hypothetical protein n=1 Tax=Caulobacter sp. 17J80-11 TaxID=2763502 RepID=UPI0016534D8E|nr:hypothetical protein [Caulobacter sp. 17J80-11]MBC6981993.1 hypothetical protein [Caulobacter sp. 17J80-11]